MTVDQPDRAGRTETDTQAGQPESAVWQDLGWLVAALRASPTRRRILAIAVGILAVLLLNIVAQVQLNRWNGQFFDALSAKDLNEFLRNTGLFFIIMSALLALVVAQNLLQELLKLELRKFLTVHLADLWLQRARPYRLVFAGDIGANPDQRVQEDTRKLAELSAELASGLAQQVFMLTTFIGVLWSLSSTISIPFRGELITIPGYMVWCALIYAGLGSLLAFIVGQPLVRLNAERSQKEAELRFALVRLAENAESIGFLRGERDERIGLDRPIGAVVDVLRAIAFKTARLTWVTSGYGWMSLIVPVLVAAPGYFAGAVTFGGLMRLVDAFSQVQASLRWLVDNVAKIADWRAALHRVMRFEQALREQSATDAALEGIAVSHGASGALQLDGVSIRLPNGRIIVADATLAMARGERVELSGPAGAGKSTLLRALAGLWPWGGGSILLPAARDMMFLPARPYIPLGTLRAAVCYPEQPEAFDGAIIRAALQRVGLGEWLPHLDRTARWDRDMTIGEQQRLTFARLILHRPGLVILDEATSAMDDPSQIAMFDIFNDDLKETSVLLVSHRSGGEVRGWRKVALVPGPQGSRLVQN